jgi:hypothetical protein
MTFDHFTYLVVGASAEVIGALLIWALVASRTLRLHLLIALDPPVTPIVANLFATAWLFPAMFAIGGVARIWSAFGVVPLPLLLMHGVVTTLAAIHCSLSLIQLVRVTHDARSS